MFVTSDIYDLKKIGRFRDFEWSENLLGGDRCSSFALAWAGDGGSISDRGSQALWTLGQYGVGRV